MNKITNFLRRQQKARSALYDKVVRPAEDKAGNDQAVFGIADGYIWGYANAALLICMLYPHTPLITDGDHPDLAAIQDRDGARYCLDRLLAEQGIKAVFITPPPS